MAIRERLQNAAPLNRGGLNIDVEECLSLRLRLHLYDVQHIVIECGRRSFIRLVDDELNSGLHHRRRHWVNVHWTPVFCLIAGPKCQTLIYALLRTAVNGPGSRFARAVAKTKIPMAGFAEQGQGSRRHTQSV
jgi:hypothetical protein